MANEWDLNVLAAMKKYEDLQKNTSAVDNTVMPTSVADTYGLTKGGQKQQQLQSDLYALQEKKRIAALEAQKRSALASLNTEKQQINPAFNTALSNVAGQSARQARNLAEYLAQRGQTQSGIAAQSEMQRYSDLMGQQGLLEQQRTNALSDIAQRETQVRSAYDEGALQALLDRQIGETAYQQQLAEQQRAEGINTVGQYFDDYAREILNIESEIARGDNSRAYLLPYLKMARGDKVTGIEQAEADQAQRNWERWLAEQNLAIKQGSLDLDWQKYRNPVTRGGSGGGSRGGSGMSYSQALTAWNSGIDTPEVRAILGIGGGEPMGIDQAYNEAYSIAQARGKRAGQWTGNAKNDALDYLDKLIDSGQLSERDAIAVVNRLGF